MSHQKQPSQPQGQGSGQFSFQTYFQERQADLPFHQKPETNSTALRMERKPSDLGPDGEPLLPSRSSCFGVHSGVRAGSGSANADSAPASSSLAAGTPAREGVDADLPAWKRLPAWFYIVAWIATSSAVILQVRPLSLLLERSADEPARLCTSWC